VRHNERRRVGMRRSDVDKLDPEAVNFVLELWKPVEERVSPPDGSNQIASRGAESSERNAASR
jgi:hypothetical protein